MAGGGSFFGRVVQYVANELLVDRLANNPTFQRFAVRSAKAMEDLAQKSAQKRAEVAQQFHELSQNVQKEVSKSMKESRRP